MIKFQAGTLFTSYSFPGLCNKKDMRPLFTDQVTNILYSGKVWQRQSLANLLATSFGEVKFGKFMILHNRPSLILESFSCSSFHQICHTFPLPRDSLSIKTKEYKQIRGLNPNRIQTVLHFTYMQFLAARSRWTNLFIAK